MADRKELILQAFTALDAGDIAPFRELFDPDAKWIGVPQRGERDETPTCPNRAAIVDLLERHHANGRQFRLGKLIEDGDRIATRSAPKTTRAAAGPLDHPACRQGCPAPPRSARQPANRQQARAQAPRPSLPDA